MDTQKKLGFIGGGNMGSAIINGIILKGIIPAKNISVFDISEAQRRNIEDKFKVNTSDKIQKLISESDIIFFCVKPNVIKNVLADIFKIDITGKTFVSIVAGYSAEKIKSILGKPIDLLRIMPNTPLLVGEGMTVFEMPITISEGDMELIKSIFESLGKTSYATAAQMDAVTAVSGSGPAYAYMLIDAMADAGLLLGLPYDKAVLLAAQTVMGAAKVILDTNAHPMQLKTNVCSPGGTTIAAVKVLEENSFKGTVMDAVKSCADKSRELS
ncbi:MAG: pyrroline-5-carboxylate reductase [Eubacteriales bacterium]